LPHSLAEVYLHIVFSTKDRVPFLRDREIRSEMHAYLVGACRNMKCPSLIVGGVEDHVHILCRYGRTITLADFLKGLKKELRMGLNGLGQPKVRIYNPVGVGIVVTPRPRTALRLSWASEYNPVGVPEGRHS
jgi:REP element-mobilizing transposase RayT